MVRGKPTDAIAATGNIGNVIAGRSVRIVRVFVSG